jgi:hypothetical protein
MPGWVHWLTRYDPDDGEPYGTVCSCDIGADHDGSGRLMFEQLNDTDHEEDKQQ